MNDCFCAVFQVSEKHVWESTIASGRRACYGDSSPESPCVARCFANSLCISLRFWTFSYPLAGQQCSKMVNVAPSPGQLNTFISPPCCSTICCAKVRPSPVPEAFVVKYGVKSLATVCADMPHPVSVTLTAKKWLPPSLGDIFQYDLDVSSAVGGLHGVYKQIQ